MDGSDNFTEHYIIRLLSAHEFVLPPPVNAPSTMKPSNISKHCQLHFLFSWAVYKQFAFYKICSISHSWTYLSTVVPQYLNLLSYSVSMLHYTAFFITHLPMFYIGVHYQGHTSNQTVIWKSIDHISLTKNKKKDTIQSLSKSYFNQYRGFISCAGVTGRWGNAIWCKKDRQTTGLIHMVGESISMHAYLEDTCSVIRKWMPLSGQITRNTACHQKVWGQSNHCKDATLVYNKS